MSGQHIIIEQLRADVERLTKLHGRELLERMEAERERDEWKARHDTLADVSRKCIATAERFIATADSEWKARAEKAERERDEERHLADVRGEMLTKTERERDEARANYAFMVERAANQKLDGYRELGARAAAAEERAERAERERDARPDISAEDARAFMMFKPVPARDSREGPVMHALRAHAAKAVKP